MRTKIEDKKRLKRLTKYLHTIESEIMRVTHVTHGGE
jgi:hypothetical protein